MSRKRVSATTIIGGSDGPTSIFLVGNKGGKLSLRQKFERACYKIRKKRAVNSVTKIISDIEPLEQRYLSVLNR